MSYSLTRFAALGVTAAYTVDGVISPQYSQAVGLYLWSWFVVTVLVRASLSH